MSSSADRPFLYSPGIAYQKDPAWPLPCPWLRFSFAYTLEPDDTVSRAHAVWLPARHSPADFLDPYRLDVRQEDYLALAGHQIPAKVAGSLTGATPVSQGPRAARTIGPERPTAARLI